VFKQLQARWNAAGLGITILGCRLTPTGGVFQPQTVHWIIEEERGVGIEIE
jgi:hypothetical protein